MRRRLAAVLISVAVAAPAQARQDGPEQAYACFMLRSAEIGEARSDAGRRLPAGDMRRLSAYIDSLDLDRETDAAVVAAGRDLYLRADKTSLRRACDDLLATLAQDD